VGDKPVQWSGAVPSRLDAKLVKVQSGRTTTYDQALLDGATVTGSTTDNDDWIVAVNTETGDVAGGGWSGGGRYSMRVLGPQCVYLVGREGRRLGGPVSVPAHGTVTVNLP
jgi:hypothetical protein